MNNMSEDQYYKTYRRKMLNLSKNICEDASNGKFPMNLINKFSDMKSYDELCRYIYFEYPCDAKKLPYSCTLYAAATLLKFNPEQKKGYDLICKINLAIREQEQRDILTYTKTQFREKFENANKKHWWNIFT